MPPTTAANSMQQLLAALEQTYGPRPWQSWGKPLDVLVETILSQNTSAANSEAGYRRLRRRFKSWKQVAEAPVDEVERHIRVSGLSRQKAPRIQKMLRRIKADTGKYDLQFLKDWDAPRAFEYLRSFHGVGPKTANCVLIFSFGMPVFPVDTHIQRIASRLGLVPPNATPDQVEAAMTPLIPPPHRYPLHVLLVEHGRKTCKARTPNCPDCPLLNLCSYGKTKISAQ